MLRWSMSGRRIASSNERHDHYHHLAGDWKAETIISIAIAVMITPHSVVRRSIRRRLVGLNVVRRLQLETTATVILIMSRLSFHCATRLQPQLHVRNRDQQCPTLIKREEKKADERIACDRERKKHSAKRIHGAFPKGQAGAFERTPLFQVSKTLTLLLCQKMMIALAPLHPKAQNVLNSCLL